MGFWVPGILELGLRGLTVEDGGPSAVLLITGFLTPFFVAGIGTILLKRIPGPNPILP